MIKGISYWSFKDGLAGTHPIDSALEEAKREGFSAVELAIGTTGVLTTDTTETECTRLRSLIERSGMQVPTVACGISWGCNPADDDATLRKQAIDLHSAALQRAAWLGAKAMLMVPGVVQSPISPGVKIRYDHALERVRDAVGRLLVVAERMEVDLCIENVWNGLFYSPVELASFVDSFASERLGVYLDVGNLLGYQQYPPHWIEILGPRIKRVHVKDFREQFGWQGTYEFCGLGEGDVPWPETMAALRRIGYNKTLIAEMLPWNPALLSKTSRAMDKLMAF